MIGPRRRTTRLSVFTLVLLVCSGCSQPSFESHGSLGAFTTHLDKRLPQLLDRYEVPGASVAIIQGGETVWAGAYGYADLEHRRAMTVDAVFRAESISKPVVAWGVMQLIEEGLVDLDAPVQRYLGDWELPPSEFSERGVTVRSLLSHSAGMPLGSIGDEYAPQDDDIPSLRSHLTREARLVAEPSTRFAYSNTGFHVLELLIEEVTGRDFAAYMADEVLVPLGMHRASFTWNETLQASMPTGYDTYGSPVPPYVYPAKASGGLLAGVEGVARFVGAEMTGPYASSRVVLELESVRALHTPAVRIDGLFGFVADAYGLGHFADRLPDGRYAVWHGGQGHGWMTHFHAVPESGDGIVILTNSQRSWPLIAEALSDWTDWAEVGAVGMERIVTATVVLRVLVALLMLGALMQAVRLAVGLWRGRRRWAPWSRSARVRRALQGFLGLALLVALGWAASQPYLIAASIFPQDVGWAGAALALVGLVLILSALLFPAGMREELPSPGSTSWGASTTSA